MMFDNNLLFYDNQAYTSPNSTELDLGENPGNTNAKIPVWIDGNGIAAAGDVTITVQDTATSGSGHADFAVYTYTVAEINAGVFLHLNAHGLKRYVRLVLGGTPSAGTITAGIVDDAPTAQ